MKRFLLLSICLTVLLGTSFQLNSQTFVGSESCKICHSDKYNFWEDSGHPYKFTITEGDTEPEYPPEVINFQEQWMDSLGDGSHDWMQIAGVIGGYGWKARFVGTDGIIVGTASSSFPDAGMGHNQFNFYGGEDHGWVDYSASTENKYYNYGCFKCHTTGGETTGTWLEGVPDLGTFTEGGIGCESCHGPGSDHVGAPSTSNIDRVYEFVHYDNSIGGLEIDGVVQTPDPDGDDVNFLCGTCHNRDYKSPINASGGFIKHHEQWDEFVTTDHYEGGMTCNTCHNPHKRTIWDGDGVTMTCGTCHSDQVEVTNHSDGATCIDCHMPYAAKSGTKRGASGFVGDVRSHLFRIIPNDESMFTEDGAWVRDDDEREAALSPAYACLGCHNNDPDDDIPEKTLEQAVEGALYMHSPEFIAQQKDMELGIFPNPSIGFTNITFTLYTSSNVDINIFNTSGQLVYQYTEVNKPVGTHQLSWDGNSNTGASVDAGYYLVKVSTASRTSVQKLLMMQ